MLKDLSIIKSPRSEIEKFLNELEISDDYALQESSLKKLFTNTYPMNSNMDDVLVKVCSLNALYSTNIYALLVVAKHIIDLDIDDALSKGDSTIVNAIANVKMSNGKGRRCYSFATKYCSHHKPTEYPIYDSFVEAMLVHFRNSDDFCNFSNQDLKEYMSYKNILMKFRKHYDLESFNLKQVDQYLWQAGKKYFPKNYSKKIP